VKSVQRWQVSWILLVLAAIAFTILGDFAENWLFEAAAVASLLLANFILRRHSEKADLLFWCSIAIVFATKVVVFKV
jgi:hypothetical protein